MSPRQVSKFLKDVMLSTILSSCCHYGFLTLMRLNTLNVLESTVNRVFRPELLHDNAMLVSVTGKLDCACSLTSLDPAV